MQVIRLQNLVEKITLLQASDRGVVPVVLVSRGKKRRKKKRSRMGLGMAQNLAERCVKAQKAFANALSDRFNSSQRRKTDAWLVDLPSNLARAGRAAVKASRVYRVPS